MTTRTAAVYRMVMEDHVCPYGIKTVDLVKRQGFEVDDHHLTSREETDAFKDKYDVETTRRPLSKASALAAMTMSANSSARAARSLRKAKPAISRSLRFSRSRCCSR